LIALLMSLAVFAFAAPAAHAAKTFSITIQPSPLVGLLSATGATVTVKFTNSANGNSTFNSLELDWSSAITATSATLSQNGVTLTPSAFDGTRSVAFTNLSPVKPNNSVTLTLTGVKATSTSCSQAGVTWTPNAWTGSPTSPSNVFTATPTTTTTPINAGCSLAFVYQPGPALAGAPIPGTGGNAVTVAVLKPNGQPDPSYSGTIGLSIAPNTGAGGAQLLNGDAISVNSSTGYAQFANLSIDKPGTGYRLRATASTGGYLPVDSAPFSIFGGTLACSDYDSSAGNQDFSFDPRPDLSYSTLDGAAAWGLVRGPNWKANDDSTTDCLKVDYSFGIANGLASFLWDKTTGQHAAFKYVVVWPAETVDATTGWPSESQHPRVSWGIDNPDPSPGSTDFVPAMICKSDDLTLPQAQILPVIPDQPPFNTNPNPQFQPGSLAKVCVTQQGFTSGVDGSGNVFVQFWTKVVDEADSWLTQR
jgi:hypothetical protein